FVSLTLKNDSAKVKGVETAKFVLKYQQPEMILVDGLAINVDSLIVNLDSLPMGVRVDSVVANFVFGQLPSAAYAIYTDNYEKKLLTGNDKDTLNFMRPVVVQVVSYDEKHKFYYRIKVNVHKVIPYLYNWVNTAGNIAGQNIDNQFATVFDNKFFYYINYNNNEFLYNANTSYSGLNNASSQLSNLPPSADLQSIKFFNNKLYLFSKSDNKIYSTDDGYSWAAADFSVSGYTLETLIMNYKGKLWGIAKNATDYYSVFSGDGASWQIGAALPADFPVEKFAAVPNSNHTGNPKAFVYGGLTKNGAESTKAFSTEDGLQWISFQPLKKYPLLSTGMSIVNYNNTLLMFGGKVDSLFVQVSVDEGFSWNKADTAAIKLPPEFTLRTYQTTFVDEKNRIVIVGGKDSLNNSLSDIWTMKLNSIDWEK
ncbi:MAG: DUF6242 domain-containing protein, partial [Paludibacter sp.]|nr:DUF6242 domain-containing protein [Paludibacter sp.]